MSQFIIQGPTKLSGSFQVGGSKNAVLPIMAASLLTRGPLTLTNVPQITDVDVMCEILVGLGVRISRDNHSVTLDATNARYAPIPKELSAKMRASILVLAPMLARFGEVVLPLPGGDIIGSRPLDVHLSMARSMGVDIRHVGDGIEGHGKPHGSEVFIEALSVTGTENALMAAVLAEGTTTISMAAVEPHVTALAEALVEMGAHIEGLGSHWLTVHGVKSLHGAEISIIPDYLEAGTVAIAAAATRSELRIEGFWKHHNESLLLHMKKMGVNFEAHEHALIMRPSAQLKPITIKTDIFPGFPSDLQAPMAVLLTQAQGTSEIFETVFEGRLNYMKELERLGANVFIRNGHTGIVIGPTPFHGKEIVSIDIRAGATMVIAALLAEGITTVDGIEHVDRGYEHFDERLNAIGAYITRAD